MLLGIGLLVLVDAPRRLVLQLAELRPGRRGHGAPRSRRSGLSAHPGAVVNTVVRSAARGVGWILGR
jgi:hypothetical protein